MGSFSGMGFWAAAWEDRRALVVMKRVRGLVLRAERTMPRETAARGLVVLMLVGLFCSEGKEIDIRG